MQPADCKNRGLPLISPSAIPLSRRKGRRKERKKIPSSSERRPSEKTCFSLISNRGLLFFFPSLRVVGAAALWRSLRPSRGENPDERRPSSPAHLALCRPSCNQRQRRRRRPLMCARRFLFPPSHRLLRLSLSLSDFRNGL